MIVQSVHKEEGYSKNKFFEEDNLLSSFPSAQLEPKTQK
jgi:hypothetical protein